MARKKRLLPYLKNLLLLSQFSTSGVSLITTIKLGHLNFWGIPNQHQPKILMWVPLCFSLYFYILLKSYQVYYFYIFLLQAEDGIDEFKAFGGAGNSLRSKKAWYWPAVIKFCIILPLILCTLYACHVTILFIVCNYLCVCLILLLRIMLIVCQLTKLSKNNNKNWKLLCGFCNIKSSNVVFHFCVRKRKTFHVS